MPHKAEVIQKPLRIAHRGASGYEAENTASAFKKAIELDVDVIECDVQLTADGVPIIRHDKLLNRTTNTTGYTWEFSWSEYEEKIRTASGENILSLEELCALLKDHRQKLFIDLKTFGAEKEVLETCQKHLPAERIILGCFHAPSINNSKNLFPEIKTSLILEGRPIPFAELSQHASFDILSLGFDSVDQELIQTAQDHGTTVFVWTVNYPEEIARAKRMNVDGIVSDFPDRI